MLYLECEFSDNGCLDLIETICAEDLDGAGNFSNEDLKIKRTKYVVSYNWLESSTAAIVVPGEYIPLEKRVPL